MPFITWRHITSGAGGGGRKGAMGCCYYFISWRRGGVLSRAAHRVLARLKRRRRWCECGYGGHRSHVPRQACRLGKVQSLSLSPSLSLSLSLFLSLSLSLSVSFADTCKARGCGGARSAQHVGTAQRGTVCRHDYPNHTEALQAWQNPLPGLAGQEEVPWQDSFAVHMDGQVLPPSLSIVKLTV